MGTRPKYRPTQLPTNLLQIRRSFRFSQSEMLQRLTVDQTLSPARISEYESGSSIPSHLMAYGRTARLPVEILIDDEAILPKSLPGHFNFHTHKQNHTQIPLTSSARVELFILEGAFFNQKQW